MLLAVAGDTSLVLGVPGTTSRLVGTCRRAGLDTLQCTETLLNPHVGMIQFYKWNHTNHSSSFHGKGTPLTAMGSSEGDMGKSDPRSSSLWGVGGFGGGGGFIMI